MNRLALFLTAAACAQDVRQIVNEAQKRGTVATQRYEGLLEVVGSGGRVTTKRWRTIRLGSFGQAKVVIRFTAPPEVKGVALMVVNHPDRSADQWMWTPATGRERRIALQDRSTRFFGTDFSFEDLEERDVEQYDYRLLGSEPAAGVDCWKIESRPRQTKKSQYTRSVTWLRKTDYVAARVEFFSRDQLVRRAEYSQIENIQGIWTPRRIEMTDLGRNSRTVLQFEKMVFNTPIPEDEFTLQALKRE
ncbi:MAG: outer membrane lipoprotein-sorting protein [Bryobacteraceae bacterium]